MSKYIFIVYLLIPISIFAQNITGTVVNDKNEDIELGVPKFTRERIETIRKGKVKFFSSDKGYGFITDKATKESIFVHANDAYDDIRENHNVEYEMGKGPKGAKALNVTQIK